MNLLRKILPILALIALSDIHWGAMQLATWVEMTVDAIHSEEGVLTSVYQTMTGEKKCSRCCQLEKDLEQNKDQSGQWESKTLVLDFRKADRIFPPERLFQKTFFAAADGPTRSDEPLSPPPRFS